MKGILGFHDEPLVSMDMKGDERSSIVDGQSTHGRRRNLVRWPPGTTTSGATPAA